MTIGQHRLAYEVLEGWERLPEGWSFVEVDASYLPRAFCVVVILYGGSVRGGIDEAGWSVRLTGSFAQAFGDG